MSRTCPVAALALLLLLSPAPARSAASYTVGVNGYDTSGADPLARDTSFTNSSPFQTFVASARVQAAPGLVFLNAQADQSWPTVFSMPGGVNVLAEASTGDFVISGPPGETSVTGTFYVTFAGSASSVGGGVGNDGQGGLMNFWADAGSLHWRGLWWAGNATTGGAYGFAGLAGPSGVAALTGTFPVGPFGVHLRVDAALATYGNMGCLPGTVICRAGSSPVGAPQASVGNPDGHVMDLPPGYTVNSTAWNVVDNHFLTPLLATPPSRPASVRGYLALRSSNPCSGPAQLEYSLANAGDARLLIVDVTGRTVRTLAAGWHEAGPHTLAWDGARADGHTAAPGVYFAVLDARDGKTTQRIVRVR